MWLKKLSKFNIKYRNNKLLKRLRATFDILLKLVIHPQLQPASIFSCVVLTANKAGYGGTGPQACHIHAVPNSNPIKTSTLLMCCNK